MVDFVVFNAAVQSARVLWEFVSANKHLAENRELVTAVSKINSDLMSTQNVALNAQQEQAALAQRIRELEQKIMTLENWKREAKRYVLTEIASEVFAHCLKPGMEQGEQPHKICTHCYNSNKKEVLQSDNSDGSMSQTTYTCPGCEGRITVRHSRGSGGEIVSLKRERSGAY